MHERMRDAQLTLMHEEMRDAQLALIHEKVSDSQLHDAVTVAQLAKSEWRSNQQSIRRMKLAIS